MNMFFRTIFPFAPARNLSKKSDSPFVVATIYFHHHPCYISWHRRTEVFENTVKLSRFSILRELW
jgi:hypothetical protein